MYVITTIHIIFSEGTSSRAHIQNLHEQIRDYKEKIANIQQEKAILGLSAAQVIS